MLIMSSNAKHTNLARHQLCIDPHGYDAGKKIKGKKRHILVDTLGLLLHAIVHPADVQDRDCGRLGVIPPKVAVGPVLICTG